MPLLWGGLCLGLWALLDAFSRFTKAQQTKASLPKLGALLLLSLGAMVAWRSASAQNTLAAALCLAGIALAAHLSAKADLARAARVAAWGWLLAGLCNAALGLIQYFGWTDEPTGVAFGFLRQRNHLATLCNISLLALLYLWWAHAPRLPAATTPAPTAQSHWHRLGLLAAAVLPTAALAASCSRTGLLELLIWLSSAAVFVWRSPRLRRLECPKRLRLRRDLIWLIAQIVVLYAVCVYALPKLSGSPETLLGRVTQLAPTQQGEVHDARRLLWSNTLTLIQQNPLAGVGWRELAYALRMADFDAAHRFTEQADNAHNLLLHFAAELGVPFTALWLGALLWLVLRGRPWRVDSAHRLLGWSVLLLLGIHSLVEYPLWYAPFQIALGLSAGLVFSSASPQPFTSKPSQPTTSLRPAGIGLAGIAFIAFCGYALFDYHRIRQIFIPQPERSAGYQADPFAQGQQSWLFADYVRFATLVTTPVTPENAREMRTLAQQTLHFSPEPRVLEVLRQAENAILK